jgi:hypothetical protein
LQKEQDLALTRDHTEEDERTSISNLEFVRQSIKDPHTAMNLYESLNEREMTLNPSVSLTVKKKSQGLKSSSIDKMIMEQDEYHAYDDYDIGIMKTVDQQY